MATTAVLDERRQGEIALKILRYMLRREGVRLSPDRMRDLGNLSKEIGVPIEELKQFAKPLVQELVDDCFAESRVRFKD